MIRYLEGDLDGDGMFNDSTYLDTLQLQKKKIITITGETGSGVSSVTRLLSDALDYRRFSAGGLFRNIALHRNMTLKQLNDYAGRNRVIDREIDTLIRKLGEGSEIVLDARLGYYWIHDSFRVFLKVDPEIAAKRISKEMMEGSRHGEGAATMEQSIVSIERQMQSAKKRYFNDYGIDINNTRQFDLIINTNDKTPEDVVKLIKSQYRAWLRARGGV